MDTTSVRVDRPSSADNVSITAVIPPQVVHVQLSRARLSHKFVVERIAYGTKEGGSIDRRRAFRLY